MRNEIVTLALALSLAVAGAACRRSEQQQQQQQPPQAQQTPPATAAAVAVSSVDLGSAINADKTIATRTNAFKPTDTIYAAVHTTGASPSTTIAAKWTYEDGQVVSEASQTIAPTGPATTEFHIAKPDGWPEGHYKVEVSLNGAAAGAASFSVKR